VLVDSGCKASSHLLLPLPLLACDVARRRPELLACAATAHRVAGRLWTQRCDGVAVLVMQPIRYVLPVHAAPCALPPPPAEHASHKSGDAGVQVPRGGAQQRSA
jgi:hypothetical protein